MDIIETIKSTRTFFENLESIFEKSDPGIFELVNLTLGTQYSKDQIVDKLNEYKNNLFEMEHKIIIGIMIGVNAGELSGSSNFYDEGWADSVLHCFEYLKMAEEFEIPYGEDGKIETDCVHYVLDELVTKRFHKNNRTFIPLFNNEDKKEN